MTAVATFLTMDAPADPETALVERVLAGETAAFDELVRRHERVVLGLARRILRDEDDAKEVAQASFVAAFERLSKLREGGSFRAWVIAIAMNRARTALAVRKRKVDLDAGPEPSERAVGADRLEDAERRRRLAGAVDKLPPRQREVLDLRVHEELSFKEIAEVLGSTENAAKVNYHLAVKRLKSLLAEDGGSRGEAA